ncbi:MAG: hypothetical protein KBA31_12810 [Alphaproteobacteria bacterium]|nr:hypothetical protein [Alphaproteobacteria bacterium]
MYLYHFSDDPTIAHFEPRPVRTPVERRAGQEWLNGPLVWAIDKAHSFLYLFPRECPRILIWPTAATTEADRKRWLDTNARAIAYVEASWLERLNTAIICRYALRHRLFIDTGDVGMWVSRVPHMPHHRNKLTDLPRRLARQDVELRVVESLLPLRDAWKSTAHASGIRLRNAKGWGAPAWPHSNL